VEAFQMAKALLGYVAPRPDRRLLDEVTLLRSRVRDLEAELAQLRSERTAEVNLEDGLRRLSQKEPALA